MRFVESLDKALWDFDREAVYALDRDGRVFSTGEFRPEDAEPQWLPIVDVFPDDYIEGQRWMLGGRSEFEIDPDYSPDTVLRTYPEADVSPGAFKRQAEERIHLRAQESLAETDWLVIRHVEKGEVIPQEILDTREEIREAVDQDLGRLDAMAPSEFVEFGPLNVNAAGRRSHDALKARRDRQRGRVPDRSDGPPGPPSNRGPGRRSARPQDE